jgi:D-alanyl-D-alanine carboxypeptidase
MKLLRALFWVVLLSLAQNALADRIDDFLTEQMKSHQIPGLAITLLQDGKIMKTAAYGFANLETQTPATAESVFEIGSITKQLTAAGVLLLAQEGKLSVDDKLSHYLPEIPATWSSITLRHLLTHTSGIKSYTGLDGFELRRHLTEQQFIEKIGGFPLEFQPGDSWKYCNTGYNLLGFVIQHVSGQSYWDFMAQHIFMPLGMSATTNRLPSLVLPHRASGYEQTKHVLINRDADLTDVFSAGAIVSTVLDLARWDAALDGTNLLTASSKARMWTPTVLNSGKPTNYGFGWFIDKFDGHPNIGHSGSTSGFSASIQRFPADRLAIILLTNTDEEIATTLAKAVARIYFAPAGGHPP